MRPIGAILNMEEGANNKHEQGVDVDRRTPDIGNGTKKDGCHHLIVRPP